MQPHPPSQSPPTGGAVTGSAASSYGKKSSRAIGIGGAAAGASAFSSSRSGESLHASMHSGAAGGGGAGGGGHTASLSSSLPSNISPAMRAIREPVRIASISPATAARPQTAAAAPAGHSHAQWNAHNASLNTPASAAAAPVRTSSRSPAGMLGSPPSSATLAPPTERTRLLLESGFSLRDEGEGEPDEERDGYAGPLIHQSYGSSRLGSASASPSPEQSLDVLAAVHTARQSKAFVAFILPVTIILCVGNSVTWKRTLNRFASVDGSQRNLEFFVNQWTLVLYTLIAGTILAYRWMFTSIITPEMRSFPKSRFALMGGLDAVAGLFAIVGGALTAGQVQIVVQQANIPITMALSRMYLKISSYAWSQYIGASIIVIGGMVSAFGSGGEGVSAHVVWFGPVLILIGIIPGSMSNVYKESQFKSENIDIYFLTTYVAVWQTLLSFVCVPLFTLSYFGGIPLADMPSNLRDGWYCFLGRHVEGYWCEDPGPSTATILLLYVLVNFAFNMSLLSMVKHGSALFLVIAVAVALPITNLVFTQRWAMGGDVEALSLYNLLGILFVVGGFLLYSLVPEASTQGLGDTPDGREYCREFVVPTGASGHCLYLTEYLPHADILPHEPLVHERRHSFDFHSSPSVRDVQQARKQRVAKLLGNRTPSRTP